MNRAKNCETLSKFVNVMPRILWPLFSGHGVYIIMKAVNGFLMKQRQMALKDECGYTVLENFIGHVCRTTNHRLLS